MAVIRLILLVAVLGGLTLLLVQNWSPALSLVFLGMRTQPLPLAMWILFSTATGAFTSIAIATLFKLSNYFAGGQRQSSYKSTASSRAKATRREEPTSSPASPPPPASKTKYPTSDEFDDWETNSSGDDDWNFDEKPEQQPTPSTKTQQVKDSKTYERQQPEPKSTSESGSVYSYSYREPKNTAAGKTESIYDADYRVIIPPYQPPTTNQQDADDDDWKFFDDDDSEDGDDRSRR
ncbi:MAG: LapA family protein [Komarekiella atlantica HA4396-MV6]|jgi:hypothetical protein|nr:LapA family protein [Komarekiella atlantica HA4396-MV6]